MSWISWDFHVFHEFPHISMDSMECLWIPSNFYGFDEFLWISWNFHGCHGISMDFMDFYGLHKIYMNFIIDNIIIYILIIIILIDIIIIIIILEVWPHFSHVPYFCSILNAFSDY